MLWAAPPPPRSARILGAHAAPETRGPPTRSRKYRRPRRRSTCSRWWRSPSDSTRHPVPQVAREEAVDVARHAFHQLGRPAVHHRPRARRPASGARAGPTPAPAAAGRVAAAAAPAGAAPGWPATAVRAAAGRPGRRGARRSARRRCAAALIRVACTASGSMSNACSGPKPSLAAAIESTPEPQPRSSAGPGSSSWSSASAARVEPCAPVPNARPGSITTAIGSGCDQGGPTHSRPSRTGRWKSRQASSQPSATGSRSSDGSGRLLGVARSTTWSPSRCSSIPPGNQLQHAQHGQLGVGRRHAQGVAVHPEKAERIRPRNDSSGGRCPRRRPPRTRPAGDAARRSAAAAASRSPAPGGRRGRGRSAPARPCRAAPSRRRAGCRPAAPPAARRPASPP